MKCFSSNSKGASLRIHHSVVSVNDAWDISYSPPICPSSICMFTGELPGKRKINLGGRAVTADKQALLEQTRREREERERARKRTESVIRIGRIYRGHLTRRKCKYSLIELLNHTHDTRVGNTHILSILFLLNRLGYIVEESRIQFFAQSALCMRTQCPIRSISCGLWECLLWFNKCCDILRCVSNTKQLSEDWLVSHSHFSLTCHLTCWLLSAF